MPSRTPSHRFQKNNPPEQIIGDKNERVETIGSRWLCTLEYRHLSLLSIVEPSSF
jgi:hypothetical protein